jgi:uncharacterized protein YbjT (DUF2867 family)
MTMARALLASGTPVTVITPRRSPLRSMGTDGVLAVLGDDAGAGAGDAAIQDESVTWCWPDDAEL